MQNVTELDSWQFPQYAIDFFMSDSQGFRFVKREHFYELILVKNWRGEQSYARSWASTAKAARREICEFVKEDLENV